MEALWPPAAASLCFPSAKSTCEASAGLVHFREGQNLGLCASALEPDPWELQLCPSPSLRLGKGGAAPLQWGQEQAQAPQGLDCKNKFRIKVERRWTGRWQYGRPHLCLPPPKTTQSGHLGLLCVRFFFFFFGNFLIVIHVLQLTVNIIVTNSGLQSFSDHYLILETKRNKNPRV